MRAHGLRQRHGSHQSVRGEIRPQRCIPPGIITQEWLRRSCAFQTCAAEEDERYFRERRPACAEERATADEWRGYKRLRRVEDE